MRPAKTDGLIPEFNVDAKWSLRVGERNGIANQVPCIGEISIVIRLACDGDIFFRGLFLEAGGQKTIVL